MKIILFIGHHKVGSSALQGYLAQNAPALARQGVLYPAVEEQGLARMLSEDGRGAGPGYLPPNLREPHNALAFSMIHDHNGSPVPALHPDLPPTDAMLEIIRDQIARFAPQVVILAAEVFAHFGNMKGGMIARLTGALTDTAPEAAIRLTATLRRVDDYLISWHGQRLRFGQKVRALPQGALNHYMGTIHFDYRKMLEGWVTALPEAELRLRPYGGVLAAGGSVADFMAQPGLPELSGVAVPSDDVQRVNTGLHRGLIEIARRCNDALEPEDAGDVFRVLLQLGPTLDLPRPSAVELYGAEARNRLVTRFAPIKSWLETLSDRPLLPDLTEIARLRPYPEHEVNRAALAQLTGTHAMAFAPRARAFLAGLELVPNYP